MSKPQDKTRAVHGAEVTLVASYTTDFEGAKAILDGALHHQWAPSQAEFIDVANQSKGNQQVRGVNSVRGFLSAIQLKQTGPQKDAHRSPATIRRLNLFAHGTKTSISLRGAVKKPRAGQEHADVTIADGDGSIDATTLDAMESQSDEQTAASRKLFARSAKDAGIYIYACNSGVNEDILQRVANFFQVPVYGFKDVIEFCPSEKAPKEIRRGKSHLFYKIGETTCAQGSFNFHELTPSISKEPKIKTPQ